jgi:hypothetical protein
MDKEKDLQRLSLPSLDTQHNRQHLHSDQFSIYLGARFSSTDGIFATALDLSF